MVDPGCLFPPLFVSVGLCGWQGKKKKNACVRVHEDEPENEDAEMLKAALKVC